MYDCIGSYNEGVERNIGIVSISEQEKIKNTTVGVVGVGGCGGLTSILLAKMGFGRIIIYDNDKYEVSNLNRQMLATIDTVDSYKADIAGSVLKLHNPFVTVESYVTYLSTTDRIVDAFKEADVIIVTVDNLATVVRIVRAAKQLNIPAIITGPFGWKCFVTVVEPNGKDYEGMMNSPSFRKELTDEVVEQVNLFQRDFIFNTGGFTEDISMKMRDLSTPIVTFAPVVNLASTTAVLELVKLLTGRGKIYRFPQYFTIDLLTNEAWSVHEVGIKTIDTYKERHSKE
jgi:molybdopterin/thiamine biosynthesis adenylyltransferase